MSCTHLMLLFTAELAKHRRFENKAFALFWFNTSDYGRMNFIFQVFGDTSNSWIWSKPVVSGIKKIIYENSDEYNDLAIDAQVINDKILGNHGAN